MNILNTRLYSSFFDGMSRVLDIGATRSFCSSIRRKYFLSSRRLSQSNLAFLERANFVDSCSISSDWIAVGNDIKFAISQYTKKEI